MNSSRPQFNESKKHTNPLLEGFVLCSTQQEMFKQLAYNPFMDPQWIQDNRDIDLFPAYVKQVVSPIPSLIGLGLEVHRAIKLSAHQHDPLKKKNQRKYNESTISFCLELLQNFAHIGFVFSGITGVGKTFSFRSSLNTIPQTIARTNLPGLKEIDQINYLLIDMSAIASVNALAEQILMQIDMLTNANGALFDAEMRGARQAYTKMARARRLMKTHFVSLLALDEIQASNFAHGGADPILQECLLVANDGIALGFSGNPLGFKVRETERVKGKKQAAHEDKYVTQIIRRLFATNERRLDVFTSVDDPDFVIFSKTFANVHIGGHIDEWNKNLEQLKLNLTGGFQDFYVELHIQMERLRFQDPKRPVDERMIREAAGMSTKLARMSNLIEAFRETDLLQLRKFKDVDYEYYHSKWKRKSGADLNDQDKVHNSQKSESPDEGQNCGGSPITTNVATEFVNPDLQKYAEGKKKQSERRIEKQKAESSPEAQRKIDSVKQFHLDQLDKMIAEKSGGK